MLFRKRLFTILAVLALAWIAFGFLANSNYNAIQDQKVGIETSESGAYQAGQFVGSSMLIGFFLCTGLPAFITFALLAWRNGVGLTNERRHREILAEREQMLELLKRP